MFIVNFDYISPDITLFYEGSNKHSSIFSGILSIFLTIFAFTFGYFLSIDFIFHKNPISFYYKKAIKDLPPVYLNPNNLFHYVTLINSEEDYYNDTEGFTQIIGFQNVNPNNISSIESLGNSTYWIYENCEEEDYIQFDEFLTQKEREYLNNSFCISKMNKSGIVYNKKDKNFEYPITAHGVDTDKNINYGILIGPCVNNSENGNNCKSSDEISAYVKYKLLSFHFFNFYIDVSNYLNPVKYYGNNDSSLIYISGYINLYIEQFYPVEINTNNGIIFDNERVKTVYHYSSRSSKYIQNKYYYTGYIIQFENLGECYDRTYKKLQDIAGGIDGIIQTFILFCQFLNSFFYHDFQVINDFNKILEEKVTKIRISSLNTMKNNYLTGGNTLKKNKTIKMQESNLNFIDPSLSFNPNSMNNQNSMNVSDKNIKINSYFKVNETKISHEIGDYNQKLTTNFKIITWIQYFCNQCNCYKKNTYIKNIESMREEMLSEKRMFKNFFYIKNLKEKVYSKNNMGNHIEPLSNMKSLKSLKIPMY